jgi:hypothetical protein
MFHGEFNDFLKDLNKHKTYRELLEAFPRLKPANEGKPDKNRMFDVELILRLFALHDFYNPETRQYPESKGETLNEYMRRKIAGDLSLSSLEDLEGLFLKLLDMVKITFKGNHFKSFSVKPSKNQAIFSKQLNAAVFDVQMLGFIEYDIDEIQGKTEVIYNAFIDLCSFERDFSDAITRSTNQKVNERISLWKQTLQSIIENYDIYLEDFIQKKQLFEIEPLCKISGEEILTFEECDYYDGNIYHKCNSPKLEKRPTTRMSVNTNVCVEFRGEVLEYENVRDALNFLIDYVSEKILEADDPHDIERLQSLSFIGTQDELLSKVQSGRSGKILIPFADLRNQSKQKLYVNISGGRTENISNFTIPSPN